MGIHTPIRHLLAAVLFSLATVCWAGEAGKVVLSVGEVRLQGQPAKAGHSVQPGDHLSTGADGYLYIKTVDNGFLILRPNSEASIVAYQADTDTPANSRFKIELQQGVARSISGQAVKNARQNFRFNTPIAAIGVRGTDFTVFTDAQTTRIAVLSGGVVVSGFGQGCSPEGNGPCESPNSRELFARQSAEVLQISRGQQVPELIRGKALLPDVNTPPLPDEPGKTSRNSIRRSTDTSLESSLVPLKLAELDKATVVNGSTAPTVTLPNSVAPISWGRWKTIAEQSASINLDTLSAEGYRMAALTGDFALLRHQNASWQAPTGSLNFALQGSMAQFQRNGATQLASLENASLSIDFDRSRFATQFDLVSQDIRLTRQAQGNVGSDGSFSSASQFLEGNNMTVQGVLAGSQASTQAGYTFQSRIDDLTVATGVALWGVKK